MKNQILLYQLQRLMENLPDFAAYEPESELHNHWMGSAYALVYQWKPFPAISLSSAIEFMPIKAERNKNIERMLHVLSHAVSELESTVANSALSQFNQQNQADFVNILSTLMLTVSDSVLITDVFLDAEILQTYLAQLENTVTVRLLVKDSSADLHAALANLKSKSALTVELRLAPAVQDRLIFIDALSCWMPTQSVKNPEKIILSGLVPLTADLTKIKRDYYEALWSQAKVIA